MKHDIYVVTKITVEYSDRDMVNKYHDKLTERGPYQVKGGHDGKSINSQIVEHVLVFDDDENPLFHDWLEYVKKLGVISK